MGGNWNGAELYNTWLPLRIWRVSGLVNTLISPRQKHPCSGTCPFRRRTTTISAAAGSTVSSTGRVLLKGPCSLTHSFHCRSSYCSAPVLIRGLPVVQHSTALILLLLMKLKKHMFHIIFMKGLRDIVNIIFQKLRIYMTVEINRGTRNFSIRVKLGRRHRKGFFSITAVQPELCYFTGGKVNQISNGVVFSTGRCRRGRQIPVRASIARPSSAAQVVRQRRLRRTRYHPEFLQKRDK